MKVLVFVCFIAVCASLPITGKQILVQDGLITVTSPKYQFSIMRSTDPKKIEIVYKITGMKGDLEMSEPTRPETTDSSETLGENFDKMLGQDYTHFDVVKRIFSQFGSMVDDVTYNKILNRIEILIHNGILNKHLLVVLKYFESPEEIQKVYGLSDVMKPEIMIGDVVMPMKDGVPTRMVQTSYGKVENMLENKSEQKERLTVVPLQKDNSPKFIGVEKYLDIATPMQRIPMISQPNTQYQRDLMMERPQNMLYQQYVTSMYLQKYQGLNYQPMMNRMYEQTYMTPMNRFWETIMVPQKQQMMKNMMFQRTVPQDFMYQYPVQRDSRHVSEYIMRNMMEDPMMDEKVNEHTMMNRNMMYEPMMNRNMMYEPMMKRNMMYEPMMNRNMMYEPMMNHMMTENMMTGNTMSPRMSGMMAENIMEPHMQNDQMMEEHMMHEKMMTPYISTKMAEQLKNQRSMEQRMMHQGMMDEYMMEDMKF